MVWQCMGRLLLMCSLLFCADASVPGSASWLEFDSPKTAIASSPVQLHLSIGGPNSLGMYVAWFTLASTKTSEVHWGFSSGSLPHVVEGSSQQYLHGHGYHHVAFIADLPSGTTVYYIVGDSDSGAWSAEQSFRTAPGPNDSFNVSIFGDLGYLDSTARPTKWRSPDTVEKNWSAIFTRNTLEELKETGQIDMVWHVGDISYADASYAHAPFSFTYEETYNRYMSWMENITARLPYMTAVGNHESECHSPACVLDEFIGQRLRNFTAYNARWHMPSRESGGVMNMWYSFDYGPAHFVTINTETDFKEAEERNTGDGHIPWLRAGGFGAPGEYLKWLENDLRTAHEARLNGRGGRRWLLVAGHRPYAEIKDCCAELFKKYEVDIYFSGHVHSYSRTSTTNGTAWVVVGGAGCDEMGPPKNSVLLAPHGAAKPVTSDRYAAGVLSVSASRLAWRLIDSVDGSVLDSFDILASGPKAGFQTLV